MFTQTDGKSGLVHNHIIVSDTDMETSKGCDRQQYYQPTLMQWTDELVREHGIELDEGTVKTRVHRRNVQSVTKVNMYGKMI